LRKINAGLPHGSPQPDATLHSRTAPHIDQDQRVFLECARVFRAMAKSLESHPARYWHKLDDGRIQCDLCPRFCKLHDGQRAFCFVRARQGDRIVLTTYGCSSGFCIDPVEKKALNHFLPGTPVLSFGTSGCNLGCKFCQNWDISNAREYDVLAERADPLDIARRLSSLDARASPIPTTIQRFSTNTPLTPQSPAMRVASRALR
jgi:hypothetical protein